MKSHKTRKILIIVNSLQAGGAERAALRLAVDLSQSGDEVILCTLRSDLDFYDIPNYLRRVNYGDIFSYPKSTKNFFSRLPLLRTLELYWLQLSSIRSYVKKLAPDIVVTFEALIGTFFAVSLVNTGVPVIISERVDPNPNVYKPHWIATFCRPWVYRNGAICTVQTVGFQKWVERNWGILAFVTPNHLHDSEVTKNMQRSHSEINRFGVIAIGRLADQKDYATLLKAWKIVEYRIPSAQLKIYGNGDRVAINLLISQLGIRNAINLPSIPDILEQIKKHRILVSSSKFEGFPNVVLESLSCGIPVVSTRSSDIIDEFAMKGGVKACDVSDYLELANLIVEMIENDSEYKSMKKRALETVKDFRWSKISPFWEQVFEAAELSNGVRIGLHK